MTNITNFKYSNSCLAILRLQEICLETYLRIKQLHFRTSFIVFSIFTSSYLLPLSFYVYNLVHYTKPFPISTAMVKVTYPKNPAPSLPQDANYLVLLFQQPHLWNTRHQQFLKVRVLYDAPAGMIVGLANLPRNGDEGTYSFLLCVLEGSNI